MTDWRADMLEDEGAVRELLATSRRIAVLGIKPEDLADQPAHYVPRYMQEAGYEIIPVPVYYPEVREILGEPVYRRVADIPGPVDIVEIFRRPNDVPQHVPDILAKKPRAVWFQPGTRNEEAARELAQAGIQVVEDRCMMVDHRRLM